MEITKEKSEGHTIPETIQDKEHWLDCYLDRQLAIVFCLRLEAVVDEVLDVNFDEGPFFDRIQVVGLVRIIPHAIEHLDNIQRVDE